MEECHASSQEAAPQAARPRLRAPGCRSLSRCSLSPLQPPAPPKVRAPNQTDLTALQLPKEARRGGHWGGGCASRRAATTGQRPSLHAAYTLGYVLPPPPFHLPCTLSSGSCASLPASPLPEQRASSTSHIQCTSSPSTLSPA